MINDRDIEKAIDWLRDNAEAAAQARANRVYLEEYRKSLKAQLMQEHNNLPISAQERDAYADPRYIAHLEALKQAVHEDEKARFLRAAAEAKVGAWQTFSANNRATRI